MNQNKGNEFVNRLLDIYGDTYDFSKTVYTGAWNKVTFTCKIHGDVEMAAANLLRNRGCPLCGRLRTYEKSRNSFDTFLERAKAAHGDLYDYSKVVYTGVHHRVTVVCPVHGDFEIKPYLLWTGKGCQKCARKRCGRKKKNKQIIWEESPDKLVQV